MAIENPIARNLADRQATRSLIAPRCTQIVANYALYILGNEAATDQQTDWAESAIRNANAVGEAVSWFVLNQTSYINGGSAIEDAELGGIVEAAINAHFISPPPEEPEE